MEKENVIKIRDTLKCGKNLPVRCILMDMVTVVDESLKFHFTKWDDDNGILYSFRVKSPQEEVSRDNRRDKPAITVFATTYTNITAIQAISVPIKDISTIAEKLRAPAPDGWGTTFNPDFEKFMIESYEELFHPNRYRLDNIDINNILSSHKSIDPNTGKPLPDAADERGMYYKHD